MFGASCVGVKLSLGHVCAVLNCGTFSVAEKGFLLLALEVVKNAFAGSINKTSECISRHQTIFIHSLSRARVLGFKLLYSGWHGLSLTNPIT